MKVEDVIVIISVTIIWGAVMIYLAWKKKL